MDENTVAVGKDIDLETVILQNVDLVENIGAFKEVAEQFQQLMMMYSCAIREVRTKLEVLNDEFQVQRSHNPSTHSFDDGILLDIEEVKAQIDSLKVKME